MIVRPLHISFVKIDGSIRDYDWTTYLVLFWSEKHDSTYNRIRYLKSVKSGIGYIIFHNYANLKVDSYNSLTLEKTITFHNVIILINSVWNKGKNSHFYNIFLEKVSYELPIK